jgi:hypothetical protein
MKSAVLFSALAIATVTLAAAPSQAGVGIVVGIAPPVAVVEPVPVVPVPGYIWRPGFYRWDGVRYIWVRGRYLAPPYAGAAWVPGRWVVRGGGYVWFGGHWRR